MTGVRRYAVSSLQLKGNASAIGYGKAVLDSSQALSDNADAPLTFETDAQVNCMQNGG